MRLIDRYIIRQLLWPLGLGLLVFTFLQIIPFVLNLAEQLIAKGVPTLVILKVMATLLPMALGLAIPMSLLLALLVAFGRMSSDREFVALQACGVSLGRLLRPVGLVSALALAATQYVLLIALPSANQAYREITFQILVDRAEGEVKPRIFFEDFPDLTLYVRDIPPAGGWVDVFMADDRPGQPASVYLAHTGRVLIDRARRNVEMILEDGYRHVADEAGKYQVSHFDRLILSVNPESIFPRIGPQKGEREMSIAELKLRIADLEQHGGSTQGPRIEIYKKFSIPFACLVLGLIGLALGVDNRRDGRLASFVVGIVVIFAYYAFLESGSNLAKGQFIPAWLAVWLPNIVFGALGIRMFMARLRSVDRPSFLVAGAQRIATVFAALRARLTRNAPPLRLPAVRLPILGVLDRYVAMTYLRIFLICFVALIGLFYISTFIDLSDEVLRGDATWTALFTFFWYTTPQYVYYVVPLSVLLAALISIGLLTKNSELIVMKACGISLYRIAVPLLLSAVAAGGVLVGLQETILGPMNYRAEAIRHVIRGQSPQTFDVLNRRWVVGRNGDIYHYLYFNPRQNEMNGLSIYQFGEKMQQLYRRIYVERATYQPSADHDDRWDATDGWSRKFDPDQNTREYEPFAQSTLSIEPAAYFSTQRPEPSFMNYAQLSGYVSSLRAGGFDVTPQQVALGRKISFPFVTLIMTLLAVPFAVTTGRRGAMYGIGVGIVLALVYWGAISVFGALGAAGLVVPVLAAWAPNLMFGAAAAYLLLTVRT